MIVIKRVVVWDAVGGYFVIQISHSMNVTLEDVAMFGHATDSLNSFNSQYTTLRRVWYYSNTIINTNTNITADLSNLV